MTATETTMQTQPKFNLHSLALESSEHRDYGLITDTVQIVGRSWKPGRAGEYCWHYQVRYLHVPHFTDLPAGHQETRMEHELEPLSINLSMVRG